MLLLNQDKNGILHNTLKHQLPYTSHYAGSLIRRHYAGNGGREFTTLKHYASNGGRESRTH